jgi:hypothetical protein
VGACVQLSASMPLTGVGVAADWKCRRGTA